jgi:hypothetical protein
MPLMSLTDYKEAVPPFIVFEVTGTRLILWWFLKQMWSFLGLLHRIPHSLITEHWHTIHVCVCVCVCVHAHACTVSSVSEVIELKSQGLIPNWVGDYFLLHLVQIGPGTHQASYPVGTGTHSLGVQQLVHGTEHSPVI